MAQGIRLSPSGPVIGNGAGDNGTGQPGPSAGGAPLVPGTGMQIRLAEKKATAGQTVTTTPAEFGNSNLLRASLDNPSPLLNYSAHVQINSWAQVNGAAVLKVTLQRATNDAASDWQDVASDVFEVGVSNVYRMAVCNQEMAPGDGVNDWEFDNTATKLTVRAMVSVIDQGGGEQGLIPTHQGYIRLVELF